MAFKVPSEKKLAAVRHELQTLPFGTRRALGNGIYLSLDSLGNERFQFRVRAYGVDRSYTVSAFSDAAYLSVRSQAVFQVLEVALQWR